MEIIAGVIAAVLAIGAVWFGGRSSGKDSEKVKRSEELARSAEVTKQIDEMVQEAKRKANAETIDDVRARVKSGSVRSKPKT